MQVSFEASGREPERERKRKIKRGVHFRKGRREK